MGNVDEARKLLHEVKNSEIKVNRDRHKFEDQIEKVLTGEEFTCEINGVNGAEVF